MYPSHPYITELHFTHSGGYITWMKAVWERRDSNHNIIHYEDETPTEKVGIPESFTLDWHSCFVKVSDNYKDYNREKAYMGARSSKYHNAYFTTADEGEDTETSYDAYTYDF